MHLIFSQPITLLNKVFEMENPLIVLKQLKEVQVPETCLYNGFIVDGRLVAFRVNLRVNRFTLQFYPKIDGYRNSELIRAVNYIYNPNLQLRNEFFNSAFTIQFEEDDFRLKFFKGDASTIENYPRTVYIALSAFCKMGFDTKVVEREIGHCLTAHQKIELRKQFGQECPL